MTTSQNGIGVFGLGIIGSGIASNLSKKGKGPLIYNRSPLRYENTALTGLKIIENPKDFSSDVAIICVTNEAGVEEIIFGPNGLLASTTPPKIIIDCSTIAPRSAKRYAEELKNSSIRYLDAPVTGGDVGAKNGTLTIMVGGDKDAFDEVEAIFLLFGSKITYVGESGTGQLTKCVNQIAVALAIAAMTEAMEFAKSVGLDVKKSLEIISTGSAGSWALNNYAPRILNNDLAPGFAAENMLKDLKYVLSETNTDLPVTKLITEQFEKLCKIDGKNLGNHALLRIYAK